ncbi:MAG: repeat-containing protein [Blastococcus sp.]|nr:repeat-containing protein [Blastococcus sp.]
MSRRRRQFRGSGPVAIGAALAIVLGAAVPAWAGTPAGDPPVASTPADSEEASSSDEVGSPEDAGSIEDAAPSPEPRSPDGGGAPEDARPSGDGDSGAPGAGPGGATGESPAQRSASVDPPVADTVTIALVAPAGTVPDATTPAQVAAQVSGPVAEYWAEQSDDEVLLTVAGTHGWLRSTTACSDTEALWTEIAGRIGFAPAPGAHLLLVVPASAQQCAYGTAELGSGVHAGGNAIVRSALPSLIAQVLGNNFGLRGSSRQECRGAVDGTTCSTEPYGDVYDVMGAPWDEMGALNAAQAVRLGSLAADEVRDVSWRESGGTYTLAPIAGDGGIRALRLTSASGAVHYVEFRAAIGADAYLADGRANWAGVQTGVLVRRVVDDGTSSTMLLDGTPSSDAGYASDDRVAFPSGRAVPLAGRDFALTVQEASATAATVRIDTARSATPPRAPSTVDAVAVKYAATGGSAGPLGAAAGARVCGLRNDGCAQRFRSGSIPWSLASGAHTVTGPVGAAWTGFGAQDSVFGYPTIDTFCGLAAGGCGQHYQWGSIYWSPKTGAFPILGALRERWLDLGWERGLGYPEGYEFCGLRVGGGCGQHFSHASSVYWSPATGAHAVRGAIRDTWARLGWENDLGYPTGDEFCGWLTGGGCGQHFQRGSIYWSPATGAHAVRGALRDRWAALGWESGALGYPVGGEFCGWLAGGGCGQHFQRGSIYWSPATGAHAVLGALRDRWAALGWESGALGYPVAEESCGGSMCTQRFQRGGLVWTPARGVAPVP